MTWPRMLSSEPTGTLISSIPACRLGRGCARIAANLCINRLHAHKELQMPLEDEVYGPPPDDPS
jgi:hypothetical protein